MFHSFDGDPELWDAPKRPILCANCYPNQNAQLEVSRYIPARHYTVQPITKSIHTLRLPKYSHLAGHGSTAVDRALPVLRIACTQILRQCRVFQFALRQLIGLL